MRRWLRVGALLSAAAALSAGCAPASDSSTVTAEARVYEADWASLSRHEDAPDWFRDFKLGIYFHRGVYSVPAFSSDWYPRHIHLPGHPVFEHHVATYGHPSEFGYHDFASRFTAKHFDPNEWADLLQQTGARFAGPVAEHHDGFPMWASDITPWNVAAVGRLHHRAEDDQAHRRPRPKTRQGLAPSPAPPGRRGQLRVRPSSHVPPRRGELSAGGGRHGRRLLPACHTPATRVLRPLGHPR